MTIIQSIILGIVEGLTEFLPISSTAHLIIGERLLNISSSEFVKTFSISIQLGAILAVLILYWKKIINSFDLILKILTAFLPTVIIGLLLYKVAKNYLMDSLLIISITLFIGGIILIIFENAYKRKIGSSNSLQETSLQKMTYKQAALIGVFQSIAIVPGVSRSAATILGGLSLGLNRKDIVEFSFLLALPTMVGATALDLFKSRDVISALSSQDIYVWLIGFIVSFVTAIIGIKFLLRFIKNNNFKSFAWYRIVLGLIIFITLFL